MADVIGVEVCAAFKNFFALGVGTAAGRMERKGKGENGALMHNLAANLFNQSVRELAVLVAALGGDPATAMTCLASEIFTSHARRAGTAGWAASSGSA